MRLGCASLVAITGVVNNVLLLRVEYVHGLRRVDRWALQALHHLPNIFTIFPTAHLYGDLLPRTSTSTRTRFYRCLLVRVQQTGKALARQ